MSQTLTITPALSPEFEPARKLSRIMAVLFTIGFWGMLAVAAIMPAMLIWPDDGKIDTGSGVIAFSTLSGWRQWLAVAVVMAGLIPLIFLLHHTRRVFGYFAKGQIFLAAPIGHIRLTGMWLIVSFLAQMAINIALKVTQIVPPGQSHLDWWPLVIGITTFIAAYVMAEARRIAAENAEIV